MPQEQGAQDEVANRYRILMIIWAAFLMSVGVYVVVGYFARPEVPAEDGESNTVFLMVSILLGISLIAVSFILKNKFLTQAADRQRLDSVQIAYVLAFALCEAAATFGFVALFVTGEFYSYILFIIAAIGIALHMPRRDHLLAASYKQ